MYVYSVFSRPVGCSSRFHHRPLVAPPVRCLRCCSDSCRTQQRRWRRSKESNVARSRAKVAQSPLVAGNQTRRVPAKPRRQLSWRKWTMSTRRRSHATASRQWRRSQRTCRLSCCRWRHKCRGHSQTIAVETCLQTATARRCRPINLCHTRCPCCNYRGTQTRVDNFLRSVQTQPANRLLPWQRPSPTESCRPPWRRRETPADWSRRRRCVSRRGNSLALQVAAPVTYVLSLYCFPF